MGGDGQIVMTFRGLSQIRQELALHYFPVDCFGGIQFGGDGQTIFLYLLLLENKYTSIYSHLIRNEQ